MSYRSEILLCKLLKSPKVAITHLAIEIDTVVTHHVVAMKKVANIF